MLANTEGTNSQMDAITKDSPQWLAALTLVNIHVGAQCDVTKFGATRYMNRTILRCHLCTYHFKGRAEDAPETHETPPPAITPDLLYAILEAGRALREDFLLLVNDLMANIPFDTFPDAIIRAAASLQEAK